MSTREIRTLIAIDEANFSGQVRFYGKRTRWNWVKNYLLPYSMATPDNTELIIFVGMPPKIPEFEYLMEGRNKLIENLIKYGYIVEIRHGIPKRRDNGSVSYSSNVDVVMATEVTRRITESRPDHLVLVTHDNAFDYVAMFAKQRGCIVDTAGIADRIGHKLKEVSDSIIDMSDLLCEFSDTIPGSLGQEFWTINHDSQP